VRSVLFFYLDASARANRYAPEVGTPVVNHLFANVTPDGLMVFNVGIAEVVSLPVRQKNANREERWWALLPPIAFVFEIVIDRAGGDLRQ
jgi:hypothetical protein